MALYSPRRIIERHAAAFLGGFPRRSRREMKAMQRKRNYVAAAFLTGALISAGVLFAQQKTVTVEGYVLDSACAFNKNLEKPISRDCALACAKEGSQLVILTKDGTIYWPIDSATPAKGQNARLTEFAGNRVTATGKLYDRGGSHALVIEKIAAAK